ncbi:MAG TPA: peptide deformylase [Bacteroidia bacterium]|nr:peptide deformylase [Bacteroidia bacterium]
MIYPIIAYGDPVLKKKALDIDKKYPKLKELIDDMFETMYDSSGVGLAAPQIGLSIRLFIIDGSPFEEDPVKDFKEVFINAVIKEESGVLWKFNEGCLSIPSVREDVQRKKELYIEYYDADWKLQKKTFDGMAARIIQHEYDHIEGILFTDRISPLRQRLIKNKLNNISHGIVDVDYKMKFPIKGRGIK